VTSLSPPLVEYNGEARGNDMIDLILCRLIVGVRNAKKSSKWIVMSHYVILCRLEFTVVEIIDCIHVQSGIQKKEHAAA
jgi:molybdenum cofactor biosynthesis enzyme